LSAAATAPPRYLSREDAVKFLESIGLQMSLKTYERQVQPHVGMRLGRRYWVTEEDLIKWLADRRARTTSEVEAASPTSTPSSQGDGTENPSTCLSRDPRVQAKVARLRKPPRGGSRNSSPGG
jgi:hypothetical protein